MQRARTIGFTLVVVGIHQVDIGTEIQLAAAQFAQTKHHQALHLPLRITHHAKALHKFGFQRGQRQLQTALGQHTATGQNVLHWRSLHHIAPNQPRAFCTPIAAQQLRPLFAVLRAQLRRRQWLTGIGQQLRKHCRLRLQHINSEIAG